MTKKPPAKTRGKEERMKKRLIPVLYIILLIVSSGCTNPVQTPEIEPKEVIECVPENAEEVQEVIEDVPSVEKEYIYTQ